MKTATIIIAALALAGPAHAFSFTPEGLASLPDGRVMESYQITLDPGEVIPWHFHVGTVYGMVMAGVLTEHLGCGEADEIHHAGEAFEELAGAVHWVENAGTAQVVLELVGVRLPSCYGGYNDTIEVPDGPICNRSGTSMLTMTVPSCRDEPQCTLGTFGLVCPARLIAPRRHR